MYSVEQQLAEECVNIFTNASDEPTTTLFECGSGWHEIITSLSLAIENYIIENSKQIGFKVNKYQVLFVGEKNGELIYRMNETTDIMDGMILCAIEMSKRTCEFSGKPGRLFRKGSVIKTLSEQEAVRLGFNS